MRRSTSVMIVLFLVMAGAYYYFNNREQPADIEVTLEPQEEVVYLFKAEDGLPTNIRVEASSGEVVELARNADNAWEVKEPFEAAADQGSSEAAASQITTIRIVDEVTGIDPKELGLDSPAYQLIVKFNGDVERIVEIGVVTPTESGYYVRTDGQIVIVSRAAIDPLIGLLTAPPYAETLTPSPIPPTATETPLPASPTPETASTATPTP